MTFSAALEGVLKGEGYTREAWKDDQCYITFHEKEIVQMRPRKEFGGEPVGKPYRPINNDMMAEDWIRVTGQQKSKS